MARAGGFCFVSFLRRLGVSWSGLGGHWTGISRGIGRENRENLPGSHTIGDRRSIWCRCRADYSANYRRNRGASPRYASACLSDGCPPIRRAFPPVYVRWLRLSYRCVCVPVSRRVCVCASLLTKHLASYSGRNVQIQADKATPHTHTHRVRATSLVLIRETTSCDLLKSQLPS